MNIFRGYARTWQITQLIFLISLISLISLIGIEPACANKLYRWTDEQGHVYFSDKVPPDEVNLSREVLNSEGIPTQVVERAKTKEEMRQEREKERLQAESRRLQKEQEAADQVLLRTFRSDDDIRMALNGRLESIVIQIKVAQNNIRRYQQKLADQQYKQAATLERSAKSVPQALKAEIQDTLKRISDTYIIIRQKEQEQQNIRDAFNRDLRRFRILKSMSKDQRRVVEEQQPPTVLENLIPCGEGNVCDDAWVRAEEFVLKYATTPIQIQGDLIIMAKAPVKDDDISITISRIKQENQPTMLFMDLFCKNTPMGHDFCDSPKVDKIRKAYHQEVALGNMAQ